MVWQTAYETKCLFVLFSAKLNRREQHIKSSTQNPYTEKTQKTNPLIPELRECVDNDTEHNVQSNSSHNNEEGDIEQDTQARCLKLLRD